MSWWRTFLALAFTFLYLSCKGDSVRPVARSGILDLQNYDWSAGPLFLSGEWGFHWQEWVDPQSGQKSEHFLKVPGPWNDFSATGKSVGGAGFATYRLRVDLPPNAPALALRIGHFDSAYRLYIGSALRDVAGHPEKTAEQSRAGRRPTVIRDLPTDSPLLITIQVSNYQHRNGGFPRALILGPQKAVERIQATRIFSDLFLFGAIVTIGLYHLGHFGFRQRDAAPLFFGVFCLLTALRSELSGERVLVDYFDLHNYFDALYRLEYLSFFWSVPVFLAYTRAVFPSRFFPRLALVALTALTALASIIIAFTPSIIYTHINNPFQMVTVLTGLYILIGVGLDAFRKQRPGARLFLGGFLILFIAVINEILYSRYVVAGGYFVAGGVFVFILAQALLLSRLYSLAFLRAEDLSVRLANSEKIYRHLVEDSGDIICSLDRDGRILTVNRALRSILGYEPGRTAGKFLFDLAYEARHSNVRMARELFQKRIRRALPEEPAQEFPLDFRTAQGDSCELTVRLQGVGLQNGVAIFARLSLRPDDVLSPYCLEDRRHYQIPTNFTLAELLGHSLTADLKVRLSADEYSMVRYALREILINAIEHGNLGITFAEKTAATATGTLLQLIEERLKIPSLAGRKIEVRMNLRKDQLEFVIADEGEGFAHAEILMRARRRDASNLAHGRGMMLVLGAFDEIAYNEKGNEVRLVKKLDQEFYSAVDAG